MFGSADNDDGDALHRWVNKVHRHAQLQQWTDHETLLQFELHLAGRAELLYEVLPDDAKMISLEVAVTALRDQLATASATCHFSISTANETKTEISRICR